MTSLSSSSRGVAPGAVHHFYMPPKHMAVAVANALNRPLPGVMVIVRKGKQEQAAIVPFFEFAAMMASAAQEHA